MPARHQTLRATIAWSYDLLHPAERHLLTRMAALPAAARLDMLEAVCGHDEGQVSVLDLLEQLIQKSMVSPSETNGEKRFGLLVSIRQYALEQRDRHQGHLDEQRHADYVHAKLRGFNDGGLAGYTQLHLFVAAELAHVRAALAHLARRGPIEQFAQSVSYLADSFSELGLLEEFSDLVQAALPVARALTPPRRA